MTTQVVFELHTDDEELLAAVPDKNVEPELFWRLAVFCCQQQLEKALKAQAIREHYDTIHMRARATREAKKP